MPQAFPTSLEPATGLDQASNRSWRSLGVAKNFRGMFASKARNFARHVRLGASEDGPMWIVRRKV